LTRLDVTVDVGPAVRAMANAQQGVGRAMQRVQPQWGVHAQSRMRQVIALKRQVSATARSGPSTLVKSIMYEVRGDTVTIGPPEELAYPSGRVRAEWIDQPTRPHRIEAKNGRALTIPSYPGGILRAGRDGLPSTGVVQGFTKRGAPITRAPRNLARVLFRPYVNHPGTQGMHFIADTAVDLQSSDDLNRLLQLELAREFGAAGLQSRTTIRGGGA
jgi:hypothetical protein